MKALKPQLSEAFLRSDNAGCYHNAFLLLSLPSIGQRVGITVKRYDFSEPQAGKDICDRRIAILKGHMRRFLNEGHDIKSASDMKVAIESHGGVKGCYAAVCTVQTTAQTMFKHTMTGVQALNNFLFEDGVRAWRAYNVGPGKFFTATQLARFGIAQGPTSLVVEQSFSTPSVVTGLYSSHMPAPPRPLVDQPGPSRLPSSHSEPTQDEEDVVQFACSEDGCIKVYQSFSNLQRHLDVGQHLMKLERESPYDEIKIKWAETCRSVAGGYIQSVPSTSETTTTPEASEETPLIEEGWALRKGKKSTHSSDNVRSHLREVFLLGEETGNKANAADVSTRMKTVRDGSGEKLFSKAEWLTSDQIARYFSRLSALNKGGRLLRTTTVQPKDDDDDDDFIAEAKGIRTRQQIRRELEL